MPRVHPVRAPSSASTAATRRREQLSPELLDALRRRLIALAVLVGGGSVGVNLVWVGGVWLGSSGVSSAVLAVHLIAVTLGLATAIGVGVRASQATSERSFERLGILLIAVATLLTGITRDAEAAEAGAFALNGWSAVAVMIVLLPVLVPLTPKRAVLAGLLVSFVDVGSFAVGAARLDAWPAIDEYLLGFRGDAIAVATAGFVAAVVDDLRVRLHRAHKLGSYELVELLGEGGMGEVWRAEHGLLARPAAIKLIKSDALARLGPAGREQMLARFEREAQATALLENPHTIDVYDFGIADDGTFFYAMELLDGIDLHEFIIAHGRIPPARVAYLLLQMCESLAEAHARGLVHRDIKPSNLFLCRYGGRVDFVKVLDFGLVKVLEQDPDAATLTADGVTGTPAFLPPEQGIRGRTTDARSDIYALGCVGYWLLTDHFLFEAASAAEFIVQHVNATPVPPSARVGIEVPVELERLIMQTLAKDPDDRPQTVEALAEAIRATGLAEQWDEATAQRWWAEREARAAAAARA